MRFDRSYRVLLQSPRLKDRSLHREGLRATRKFFDGLTLARGERAFFQHYGGSEVGWTTVASKSSVAERVA